MAPLTTSSLAPPMTTGPRLRPRTPPSPKEGFVVQSPDSRVSVRRPSSNADLESLSFDPANNPSDSEPESVVEILSVKGKETVPEITTKNKKKTQVGPSTRAKRRPRGSGSSLNLIWGPGKKTKKDFPPVVSPHLNLYLLSSTDTCSLLFSLPFLSLLCLH